MPITFGSVGDIIAVCLLAKDCAQALSETNGSSAEYQAIIRELYTLEQALLEIGIISKKYETIPELKSLFTSIATTVNQCRKSLETFKAKIKRYDEYLAEGCVKSNAQKLFTGSAKKILWQVKMKDEISRFRAEVMAHSMSIDQLLAAATMHTVKDQANRTSKVLEEQDKTLKDLQNRLDEVNRRVKGDNNLLKTLAKTARTGWLLHLGQELKSLMCKILITNLVTFAAVDKLQTSVMEIQRSLPAPDRPLVSDRMCYLEDAIGRVSTIPLDFIISWDVFLGAIESRFIGKPGEKKVLKKEYALQNRATGKDVNTSQDWESVFLPGLWFDMDMIFQVFQDDAGTDTTEDTCPRCHERSNQPPGLKIKCSICKQVYQRVSEVSTSGNTTLPTAIHTHAPEAPESFTIAPPTKDRPIIHPVPPSRPSKRKRQDDQDEEPASFQRVRIRTKRRKLNQVNSGPPKEAEKRPLDDMDIDVPIESPKRHKPTSSKEEFQEQGYMASQYVSEKNAQAAIRSSDSINSIPETEFNRVSGMQNPESFSSGPKNESLPHNQPKYSSESPRTNISKASKSSNQNLFKKQKVATEDDARNAGIPAGYSYKNWDPDEEPIMLLGSVFDANSLGKWIYDWTVFHYGPATSLADIAGELWLLLIQLAGRMKRAKDTWPKIKKKESRETLEDFLGSGERMWTRFARLLKVCEDYMWKAAKKDNGGKKPVSMGKNSGRDFVDSIFGKDRELQKTEKLMTSMRLWNMRFEANCDNILRYPSAMN